MLQSMCSPCFCKGNPARFLRVPHFLQNVMLPYVPPGLLGWQFFTEPKTNPPQLWTTGVRNIPQLFCKILGNRFQETDGQCFWQICRWLQFVVVSCGPHKVWILVCCVVRSPYNSCTLLHADTRKNWFWFWLRAQENTRRISQRLRNEHQMCWGNPRGRPASWKNFTH